MEGRNNCELSGGHGCPDWRERRRERGKGGREGGGRGGGEKSERGKWGTEGEKAINIYMYSVDV